MKTLPIVLLSAYCIVSCGESEKEKQARLAEQEKTRIATIEEPLKERLKRGLADPNSAQFRDTQLIEKGPKGGPVLCGEVNAKNRMGGYAGFRPFVASTELTHICMTEDMGKLNVESMAAELICLENRRNLGCLPGGPWTKEDRERFVKEKLGGK